MIGVLKDRRIILTLGAATISIIGEPSIIIGVPAASRLVEPMFVTISYLF